MADKVKNVDNSKCDKSTFFTDREVYHKSDPIKNCTQCDYIKKNVRLHMMNIGLAHLDTSFPVKKRHEKKTIKISYNVSGSNAVLYALLKYSNK